MSPSAPCSRRWRAQLPDAMPPPTSRNSTARSGTPEEGVDLRGDPLAPVLLQEVGGPLDHAQILRAGDQVDEALTGLGGEDRIGVGETHERRLVPRGEALARSVHLRHPWRVG